MAIGNEILRDYFKKQRIVTMEQDLSVAELDYSSVIITVDFVGITIKSDTSISETLTVSSNGVKLFEKLLTSFESFSWFPDNKIPLKSNIEVKLTNTGTTGEVEVNLFLGVL